MWSRARVASLTSRGQGPPRDEARALRQHAVIEPVGFLGVPDALVQLAGAWRTRPSPVCSTAVALFANGQGDLVTRSLHFSWELSGSGWATCRIWDGSTKHRESVSYCTNALADLLKGVTGLYGPHGIQRFSFDLEPAEARWILRRRSSDVHITIRRFPDMSTSFDAPDGKGTLVWTSTRPRTSLAHAVLMAAEKVWRTHGETGYLQKWGLHAFPTAELETLRHLHLAADDCALQH